MDLENLKQQQQQIIALVQQPYTGPVDEVPRSLLHRLSNHEDESIAGVFGSFGSSLRRFAQEIDLDHPGLNSICNGELVSNKEGRFGRDACDLLRVADFIKNRNLSANVLYNLKRVIQQHTSWHDISRCIDSPSRNQLHVRLLSSPQQRAVIRSTKKSQIVDLQALCKKGKEFWETQPSDFSKLIRFSNPDQSEQKQLLEQQQHFTSLGLTSLAGKVDENLRELQCKLNNDFYYGFSKVTYTQASVILGRLVGCTYQTEPILPLWNFPSFLRPEGITEGQYEPRSYPLTELWDCIPTRVRTTIRHLEQLPELGGRAAFDHFRILVPGFRYPLSETFWLRDAMGRVTHFESLEEVQRQLDISLIIGQYIVAILLGERDGESYFICYWV